MHHNYKPDVSTFVLQFQYEASSTLLIKIKHYIILLNCSKKYSLANF